MSVNIVEYRDPTRNKGRDLRIIPGGYSGSVDFLADSDDPAAITQELFDNGPVWKGDEYPGFPIEGVSCPCVEISIPKAGFGGPGPGGSGDNPGGTWITASYRTPGSRQGGGIGDPDDPQPGDAYTRMISGEQSVEISLDNSGNAIKPTNISVTIPEITVRVFKTGNSWISHWLAIKDKLNDASVTLPNYAGYASGTNLVLAAKQLRIRGYTEDIIRPGLVAVNFKFELAKTGTSPGEEFRISWEQLDEDGNASSFISPPREIIPTATYNTTTLFGAS